MSSEKNVNYDQCDLQIDGCNLHSTKFLGVIVDDKMSWKIIETTFLANYRKELVYCTRQQFYGQSLITLYTTSNAPVKALFTYCISVWGRGYLNQKNILYIGLMQKNILIIITNSDWCAHSALFWQT